MPRRAASGGLCRSSAPRARELHPRLLIASPSTPGLILSREGRPGPNAGRGGSAAPAPRSDRGGAPPRRTASAAPRRRRRPPTGPGEGPQPGAPLSAPGACAAGGRPPAPPSPPVRPSLPPSLPLPRGGGRVPEPTLAPGVHLPQQRHVALDVQRQRLHALQVVLHVERKQPGPLPARRRRPRHQLRPRQHHPLAPAAHPPPAPAHGAAPARPAPVSGPRSAAFCCRRRPSAREQPDRSGPRGECAAGPGRPAPPWGPAPLPAPAERPLPPPEQNPLGAPAPGRLATRMREALPL